MATQGPNAGVVMLAGVAVVATVFLLVCAVVLLRCELERRAEVRAAQEGLAGRDRRRVPARHRLADQPPHGVGQQSPAAAEVAFPSVVAVAAKPSATTGVSSPPPVVAAVHEHRRAS
ncbi:hypothetical protein Lesp02_70920 [Lentzea sp. NBRC 105346]|nr:hypothetical protein Lesp02_70920 [Lentzea sp. NBRC 105346]